MPARLSRIVLSDRIPNAGKFNKWLDKLLTDIENMRNITGTGILSVTRGPTGLSLNVPDFPIAIVKTTGTISARASATPGFGTVTFQMFNGIAFVDDPAKTNLKVFNYSSNSTLTTTGKYGVCLKWFGVWWLIIVEC